MTEYHLSAEDLDDMLGSAEQDMIMSSMLGCLTLIAHDKELRQEISLELVGNISETLKRSDVAAEELVVLGAFQRVLQDLDDRQDACVAEVRQFEALQKNMDEILGKPATGTVVPMPPKPEAKGEKGGPKKKPSGSEPPKQAV